MDLTEAQVARAADALVLLVREANYTYDEREVKRWILGDGGKSGNCEICDENASLGWVDMDAIFLSVGDDIDEPPAHDNCTCEVEFKTQRYRVYA